MWQDTLSAEDTDDASSVEEVVRVLLGKDGPTEVRRVPVERYRRRVPAPLPERRSDLVELPLDARYPVKLREPTDEFDPVDALWAAAASTWD